MYVPNNDIALKNTNTGDFTPLCPGLKQLKYQWAAGKQNVWPGRWGARENLYWHGLSALRGPWSGAKRNLRIWGRLGFYCQRQLRWTFQTPGQKRDRAARGTMEGTLMLEFVYKTEPSRTKCSLCYCNSSNMFTCNLHPETPSHQSQVFVGPAQADESEKHARVPRVPVFGEEAKVPNSILQYFICDFNIGNFWLQLFKSKKGFAEEQKWNPFIRCFWWDVAVVGHGKKLHVLQPLSEWWGGNFTYWLTLQRVLLYFCDENQK